MRTCSVCGVPKATDEFYRQGKQLSGACKPCYRERQRGYESTPKPEKLQRSAAHLRAIVNAAKDAPCADCGGRFHPVAMDFDHIRGEKRNDIGRMVWRGVSEAVLRAELAKCELVCANCHRVRTHLGRGFSIGGSAIRKPDTSDEQST